MSDEHPFELEPAASEPKPDLAAPVRRRRQPDLRRRPRGRSEAEASEPRQGWLARLAVLLLSPRAYYALGLLVAAGFATSLYNPAFGVLRRAWPHEVAGLGGAPFVWGPDVALVLVFAVFAACCLVALCMRAGSARAAVVLFASLLVLVAFEDGTAGGGSGALPVLLAILVGALVARPQRSASRRRPHVLLILGFALVATWLFLPWDTARESARALPHGYHATALELAGGLLDPPADLAASTVPHALEPPDPGWFRQLVPDLLPRVACLLLVVGALSLLGLGRRWARWAAGIVFLATWLATSVALYLRGCGGDLGDWQAGLGSWAGSWHADLLPYALPLAAAVADLVPGRRP